MDDANDVGLDGKADMGQGAKGVLSVKREHRLKTFAARAAAAAG